MQTLPRKKDKVILKKRSISVHLVYWRIEKDYDSIVSWKIWVFQILSPS